MKKRIILTLPSIEAINRIEYITNSTNEPFEFRFNTGSYSQYNHLETLKKIQKLSSAPLWIDLKCRQLRVMEWVIPTYSHITLNHEIENGIGARIVFRGCAPSIIKSVDGNKIFVDPPPERAIGRGQAATIIDGHKVVGYLTEDDKKYIEAAKELGITQFMASFVESQDDVDELRKLLPNATIGLKIENIKGLEFIRGDFKVDDKTFLIAARDDLFESIRKAARDTIYNRKFIYSSLKTGKEHKITKTKFIYDTKKDN